MFSKESRCVSRVVLFFWDEKKCDFYFVSFFLLFLGMGVRDRINIFYEDVYVVIDFWLE